VYVCVCVFCVGEWGLVLSVFVYMCVCVCVCVFCVGGGPSINV
jgi:hypothetical protein